METAAAPASVADAVAHFSVIDSATIFVAILVVFAKMFMRWRRKERIASVSMCGVDFLNGTVIIPFLVMISAVFYADIYREMARASTAGVAAAGAIGLFFVIGELLRSSSTDA